MKRKNLTACWNQALELIAWNLDAIIISHINPEMFACGSYLQ